MPDNRDQACPEAACAGKLFTKKGLQGHMVFKHGRKVEKAKAQGASSSGPTGAVAGKQPVTGAGKRHDLDEFLFPNG